LRYRSLPRIVCIGRVDQPWVDEDSRTPRAELIVQRYMLASPVAVLVSSAVACAREDRAAINAEAAERRIDGNPIGGLWDGDHFSERPALVSAVGRSQALRRSRGQLLR